MFRRRPTPTSGEPVAEVLVTTITDQATHRQTLTESGTSRHVRMYCAALEVAKAADDPLSPYTGWSLDDRDPNVFVLHLREPGTAGLLCLITEPQVLPTRNEELA